MLEQDKQVQVINGYTLDQGSKKEGGNGEVFMCFKEGQPYKYAMKIYKKNREQAIHEINLAKMLSEHENVVKLLDHFDYEENIVTIYEYCANGELMEFIKLNSDHITEIDRVKLFAQIVSAFKSIHYDLKRSDMTFYHRDIKPQNILIGDNNIIKVIDFGESRIRSETQDEVFNTIKNGSFGTPNYMDPYMIKREGFNQKSDIWSLGITFYEMLFNELPYDQEKVINMFKGKTRLQDAFKYITKFFQEEQHLRDKRISPKVRQCLNKMLTVELKDRYGWEDLFSDPFIEVLLNELEAQTPQAVKQQRKKLDDGFVSLSFKQQAGSQVVNAFFVMIQKGSLCTAVADKLVLLNQKLRELYYINDKTQDQQDPRIIFLKDWQNFEKAIYLLYFRSFIIFNNYNYIMTQKVQQFNSQKLENNVWEILMKDEKIFQRIQTQIYHLFEDCRKMVQGSGVEGRMYLLNAGKCEDYDEDSQFELSGEERLYFSYKHNCLKNKYNRPETFEDNKFVQVFSKIVLKLLEALMQDLDLTFRKPPQQRDDLFCKDKLEIAADMILALTLEKFFQSTTMNNLNDYRYNMNEMVKDHPDVIYAKLKICMMNLQKQIESL